MSFWKESGKQRQRSLSSHSLEQTKVTALCFAIRKIASYKTAQKEYKKREWLDEPTLTDRFEIAWPRAMYNDNDRTSNTKTNEGASERVVQYGENTERERERESVDVM